MLDPEAPDERRDQIASDARGRIESGGSLKAENAWGLRKLAYEIQRRTEADYRYYRFETEAPLLDELNHNLRITDGVMRFRIFKVDPDSPVIEPPPPAPLASSAPRGGGRDRRGGRGRDDYEDRSERRPAAAPAATQATSDAPPEQAAPEAPAEPAPEAPAEPVAPEVATDAPAENAAETPDENAAEPAPPAA